MAILESARQVERPVADPADPRRPQSGRGKRGIGVDDGLMGVALLAGPANVIMELAQPGVGYGVLESRVESGRTDRHPIKRARTTFTYLAVATAGSVRTLRFTPHPTARCGTTRSTLTCNSGWAPVCTRVDSIFTASSLVSWTMRTPTGITATA